MHAHRSLEALGCQQLAGVVKLHLQLHAVRVELAACRVGRVQALLQLVHRRGGHVVFQLEVQVVGVQRHDVALQAVVGMEAHLGDHDVARGPGMAHADPHLGRGHGLRQLRQHVLAPVLARAHLHVRLDGLPSASVVDVRDADPAVRNAVLNVGERNHAERLGLVERHRDALAERGVKAALVPVGHFEIRRVVVVEQAVGAFCLARRFVQRAVDHGATPVGCRDDAVQVVAIRVLGVNQAVSRQLRRLDVRRAHDGHDRRRALADLVRTGQIHLVLGIVLQTVNGAGRLRQVGHLREIAALVGLLTIEQVVRIGVLHVLPAGLEPSIGAGQRDALGRVGNLLGLRRDLDAAGPVAAPGAVRGANLEGEHGAVLDLLLVELRDGKRGARGALDLFPAVRADGELVARHVGLRLP